MGEDCALRVRRRKENNTMKSYYTFKVRYQDIDAKRRLRLYVLENYLLDVAGRAADEGGFGIQYLFPRGLTWVITKLSMEIAFLPESNMEFEVETWVESNAHMLSTRDFRLYQITETGEKVLFGKAKSVWTVLDLNKREIVNIFDEPIFETAVDGEVLEISRGARMTNIAEPTGVKPHVVQFSDVDYNDHCNSCKYLERMVDAYRPDWYGKALRLDIQYCREQRLGGVLDTYYLASGNEVLYQQKNEEGITCCFARISVS